MGDGGRITILHIADVHLDRPFVGLPPQDARARRRELRGAFDRCLELARTRGADLVTIGGDLWEDEHVIPDTARWVADRLGSLGAPIVIVAGNHDPVRSGGVYARTAWPPGVHILPTGPELHEVRLEGLSVWGMSWGAEPLSARALERFAAPDDGRSHALLLHGTAVGGSPFHDEGHCPFDTSLVRAAGFQVCLAGHLHGAHVREQLIVYPGSPEPLAWDETGRHAAAVVELASGADPVIELVDVNRRHHAEVEVDCDGALSSADVERLLRDEIATVAGEPPRAGVCLRARLKGHVDPGCRVDLDELARSAENGLASLELKDETRPSFDLELLSGQTSALGAFVRDLRAKIEACQGERERTTLELALDMGLRAMHGVEPVIAR